jgi:hypothetical protein
MWLYISCSSCGDRTICVLPISIKKQVRNFLFVILRKRIVNSVTTKFKSDWHSVGTGYLSLRIKAAGVWNWLNTTVKNSLKFVSCYYRLQFGTCHVGVTVKLIISVLFTKVRISYPIQASRYPDEAADNVSYSLRTYFRIMTWNKRRLFSRSLLA